MNLTEKIKEILKENNHLKLENFINSGIDLSDVNLMDIVLDENSTHDTYKLLIKNGIDINQKTVDGINLLLLASYNEDIDMVKFLVQNGADIDTKDNNGFTAVFYPIIKGNYQLVEYLVYADCDLNIVAETGFSPLLSALSVHSDLIFENDEDIGIINKTILNTYIHNVPKTHNKIAKLLIDNGADVNFVSPDGDTPYSFALKSENKEMMQYLINNGANTVNIYAKYNTTKD